MPSLAPLRMSLVSVVELDPMTFQVSVIERRSERRWLRTVEHERQATYTLGVRVGRFHDGPDTPFWAVKGDFTRCVGAARLPR